MQFDVESKDFWDEGVFGREFLKIFDVCQSCRLCFNLCPSFPTLFDAIDERNGDLYSLSPVEVKKVVDLCYQCKQCYFVCPYKPPHEFDIDFPRAVLRAKAINVRRHGLTMRERFLSDTELLGKVSSLSPAFFNWTNKNRLSRKIMEKAMGIHCDRALPRYHGETFSKWFKRGAGGVKASGSRRKVALFYTCFINYNAPEVGKALVKLLERCGIEVICPEQKCCGMPHLDVGDLKRATNCAKYNLGHLAGSVCSGLDIIAPGPTCSYMLKFEYPLLARGDEAQDVAARAYDACEYLFKLHKSGELNLGFGSGFGKVAYHLPCHLKAQAVGYKTRDLLSLLPDTKVETVEKCSGIDGTWGLRREYFDMSMEIGQKLCRAIQATGATVVTSDCLLAAMQIEQGMGLKPSHPVELLARACGID